MLPYGHLEILRLVFGWFYIAGHAYSCDFPTPLWFMIVLKWRFSNENVQLTQTCPTSSGISLSLTHCRFMLGWRHQLEGQNTTFKNFIETCEFGVTLKGFFDLTNIDKLLWRLVLGWYFWIENPIFLTYPYYSKITNDWNEVRIQVVKQNNVNDGIRT